jgi:anion-transporting  ArsA/GET3 family ATPase
LTNAVDKLLKHRMIALLGKGGVGRTSVGGALAMIAARRGLRTLVMETDPLTPIAALFGRRLGFDPVNLATNIWGMLLSGQESLEDYLGKTVPRAVLKVVVASSLYQAFVQAAPAVRELTMMGKIYHEIERRPVDEPRWDLIVFDAPASGQALNMLGMPFVARKSFGESLVGREATAVAQFFRNHTLCAMVAVTTAETLAMTETLEVSRALEKLGLKIETFVLNRVSSAAFETRDLAVMIRRGTREPVVEHLGQLAEIARAELKRKRRESRALEILRRQVADVIVLRERNELAGAALFADLNEQLVEGNGWPTSGAAADS